jgi:two-component system chemotaxis response regulator CheB
MIGVLVVDDSAFMRLALRRIIEAEGDLKVVGEVADGAAAIAAVERLRPPLVAMDLEMPGLDGVAATRRIMQLPDPPAIIMVSHHTRDGSAAALRALQAGAVDYLCKESGLGGLDLGQLDRMLRPRLRHWAAARSRLRPAEPPPAPHPDPQPGGEAVLVGASTGGPDALAAFLGALGVPAVPVVIAQHMPAELAEDFARHLGRGLACPVRLAEPSRLLRPGEALVIPGGHDAALLRLPGGGLALQLSVTAAPVHPAVDLLFRSAALVCRRAIGVVLTGMGQDGLAGAKAMAERGHTILAQSPESCVVGGMPRAVIGAGLAGAVADPAALGRRVAALLE